MTTINNASIRVLDINFSSYYDCEDYSYALARDTQEAFMTSEIAAAASEAGVDSTVYLGESLNAEVVDLCMDATFRVRVFCQLQVGGSFTSLFKFGQILMGLGFYVETVSSTTEVPKEPIKRDFDISKVIFPATDEDDGRYLAIDFGYGVAVPGDTEDDYTVYDVDAQHTLYESMLPAGKTLEDIADLYIKYGSLTVYFLDGTSVSLGDVLGDTDYDDFDFKRPDYIQLQHSDGAGYGYTTLY